MMVIVDDEFLPMYITSPFSEGIYYGEYFEVIGCIVLFMGLQGSGNESINHSKLDVLFTSALLCL